MEYDVAKAIFIKNGKKEERDIQCDNIAQEYKVIEQLYQDVDKKVIDGYTVILNLKDDSDDVHSYRFSTSEVIVPNEIKVEDYILIMARVKKDFMRCKTINIINNCIRNGYQDYDYYDYRNNSYGITNDMNKESLYYANKANAERTPDKILDLFLRKKLKGFQGLTKNEQDMYQVYEDFNIEKILYSDNTNNSLNNRNEAIMTIFLDQTYKSTNTKMNEDWEHQQHLIAYEQKKEKASLSNVFIYLTNDYVKCFLPSKLNDYQKEQFNNFLDELNEIQKLRGEVEVFATVADDIYFSNINKDSIKNEFKGINQIKEHINKQGIKK